MIIDAGDLDRWLHRVSSTHQASWSAQVLPETAPDDELTATLCAFGNLPTGGSLLFGVHEVDGTPLGVTDPQALEDRVRSVLRWVEPAPRLHFYRATVNDKALLVVNIAGREDALARVLPTNTAYLRETGGNRALAARDVHRAEAEPAGAGADRVPVSGTTSADLVPHLVEPVLRTLRERSERFRGVDDQQALQMAGVVEPAGERLTIAGLYALGHYPQQFFPHLILDATVVLSGEATGQRRQRFAGPLPEILDDAVRWVIRHARQPDSDNARDYRVTRLPIAAIRETLANALMHRDLSPLALGQPVEVVVEDSVLTVHNPGRLWHLSVHELTSSDGQTATNQLLYELCRLTPVNGGHRIVAEPGGLRNVNQALRRVGMQPVEFIDTGLTCTVKLGQRSTLTPTESQWLDQLPQPHAFTAAEQHLVVSLMHGRHWTAQHIAVEFGPGGTAYIHEQLRGLVERGLVEHSSSSGHDRYRLHEVWVRHAAEFFHRRYRFEPAGFLAHTPQQLTCDVAAAGPPETPADPARRAAATSKHGETVFHALDTTPRDIHDLTQATGLSASQIRYAMQRLIAEGLVQRSGGQGHRQTTYQRDTQEGSL